MTQRNMNAKGVEPTYAGWSDYRTNWSLAKLSAETNFDEHRDEYNVPFDESFLTAINLYGYGISSAGFDEGFADSYGAILNACWITNVYVTGFLNTALTYNVICKYLCPTNLTYHFDNYGGSTFQMDFDGYGVFEQGGWKTVEFTVPFGINPASGYPTWCDDPTGKTNIVFGSSTSGASARGFYLQDAQTFVDWNFNYCTNKYW